MDRKRKSGEGTVRLRKDGRWEGRVVIGYDEKGLPKTKSVLARTKGACVEKLNSLKAELAPPILNMNPKMTFGEWLDYWYNTYSKSGIRPSTQESYELHIYKHITPEIGGIPLEKLTQSDLMQFYARLKESGRLDTQDKGSSDRVIRLCHGICKSALNKAVEEKLIRANPADGCKLPSAKPGEMRILTPEEIQRFLIQAKYGGYYEIFLAALTTGLRRGEVMALQWDDLNEKTGELRIERQARRTSGRLLVSLPKTKASIWTIILPESVVKVLTEYHKTVDSRWIFPSPVKEDSPRDPVTSPPRRH